MDKENHKNKTFHFISSNGLWMNEAFETKVNTAQYTVFDLENDKYRYFLQTFYEFSINKLNYFDIIGQVMDDEFFTDGNDTILFYDKTNESIICLNFYS